MEVYERVEDDQNVVGSSLNPRTRPYWTPLDIQPIGLKSGDAAPWIEKISIVNQQLRPPLRRYGHESMKVDLIRFPSST
jgi:hypothetical protein